MAPLVAPLYASQRIVGECPLALGLQLHSPDLHATHGGAGLHEPLLLALGGGQFTLRALQEFPRHADPATGYADHAS